jgi:hypothetical protein
MKHLDDHEKERQDFINKRLELNLPKKQLMVKKKEMLALSKQNKKLHEELNLLMTE